ncbi:MAG TPA: helix-turn-helix transcriptional regulator [Ktedonobacteraceae bacterium]|nr:helix-turn-helix transcriptional regulator [Ktedonobacteraceae bacterium]
MTPHVTLSVPAGPLHSQIGSSTTSVEEVQLVTYLLNLGQMLCEQVQSDVSRLCQEVKFITQGRAQLRFGRKGSMKGGQLPANTLLSLPVQFGYQVYGTLCVASDPLHTDQLSISLPIAQLLAQTCSWLLYTMEQSAFLRGQCQQLDYQVHGPLTRREREVLALMCRGYSQEAIADQLSIAPATVGKHRQHIYEQLGVHCERDALLAAYHVGFFSLVDDVMP